MAYEPVKFLDASDVAFESAPFGELTMRHAGRTYDRVRAVRTLPTTDPWRYISLRGQSREAAAAAAGADVEVGILKDIAGLGADDRHLLEEALSRRYLALTIVRIRRIEEEFGYLYWDVDTDRGPRTLVIHRWKQSNVIEMGPEEQGRILIDIYGNRSLIPDLQGLDERSRRLFDRYIYW
jgi:hypothetical protein